MIYLILVLSPLHVTQNIQDLYCVPKNTCHIHFCPKEVNYSSITLLYAKLAIYRYSKIS